MTNSYEIVTLSGMKAYCWYSDYWVKFTLNKKAEIKSPLFHLMPLVLDI